MSIAPFHMDEPTNDLFAFIEHLITTGFTDKSITFYAFGERWGPTPRRRDMFFGFLPGSGIHEIHMNQGSRGNFAANNGVSQDGGLLVHFGETDSWTAIFFAFQSQDWNTDPRTGDPLLPEPSPATQIDPLKPAVSIIAALINPTGRENGRESVTLLNRTDTFHFDHDSRNVIC